MSPLEILLFSMAGLFLLGIPIFIVKNHKIDPLAINSPILQFLPNL